MNKFFIAIVAGLLLANLAQAQSANSVALLWESDGYTPTFYVGHSQPAVGNTVKVVALPNITNAAKQRIEVKDLNFMWSKDHREIASASGVGKNSLSFTVDPSDKAVDVQVRVKTRDEQVVAEKSITISIKSPVIVLYEEEPLTGLSYNQAVGQVYNLAKPEVTMRAEPYYFSTSAVTKNNLNFTWLLNGKNIVSNPSDPRQITFVAPEEGGTGENAIDVMAENSTNVLQTAKNRLLIKFGLKDSSF